MIINYKLGNITGTAILYTNKDGNDYSEVIDGKELLTQEKKQAKLFKLLNTKKLQAVYSIL